MSRDRPRDATYVILGEQRDPCCSRVREALHARGHNTQLIAEPFTGPHRFSWSMDTEGSRSRLVGDGTIIEDSQIAGVLVLGATWIDPTGWDPDDLPYVQAETQAALLAWLWSLPCPVVNRYPPSSWYRPHAPLLAWRPQLRACGLVAPEMLITNDELEAKEFGRSLAEAGVPGAVLEPLTGDAGYLVASQADWSGIAALQRVTPVLLSAPHDEPITACVVGELVVWAGETPPDAASIERGLRRLAHTAGLTFLQVTLAHTGRQLVVVDIETRPDLARLGSSAQEQVVEGIVHALTQRAVEPRRLA